VWHDPDEANSGIEQLSVDRRRRPDATDGAMVSCGVISRL
jgi:hypothetical protein